jgi:hypothetical protein
MIFITILDKRRRRAAHMKKKAIFRPLDWLVRRRQFVEAIEPYIKLKVEIYKMAVPIITASDDGTIDINQNFTDVQENTLKQLDELIAYTRDQIYNA